MISVPASEVQRNFSEYEERAIQEPVEVTHAGRSPSYLASERLFKDMMSVLPAGHPGRGAERWRRGVDRTG